MLRFRGARCCGRGGLIAAASAAKASPTFWSLKQGLRLQFLVAGLFVTAAAALLAIYPPPAPAARMRAIQPRTIIQRLDRGLPVNATNVEVRGSLRLPRTVVGPFVIRDSKIDGSISGVSTSFDSVFALSDTTIKGSLRLPYSDFHGPVLMLGTHVRRGASFSFASFEESALLDYARFGGRASFEGSVFHAPARFAPTTFKKTSNFRFAEFADLAIFEVAQFGGAATFSDAEFRSSSDFAGAGFFGPASLSRARFFGESDFGGSHFMTLADLDHIHFGGDTSFRRATFLGHATFAAASSPAVLDFDGAQFMGLLDLRSAKIDDAEFSGGEKTAGGTEFEKAALFDQATIQNLNLDGAVIGSTILLPDPRGIGRISNLRMDPGDVGHIRAVPLAASSGRPRVWGTRSAQENALSLIESAARSGGDLAAANQAEIRRLTLKRQDERAPWAAANWTLGWEIGGYLVRPWHPFLALVAFFGLAALLRSWKTRHDRKGLWAKIRGFFATDLWQSITGIWRLSPSDGAARFVEELITKVLVVALVLSLGNAEPGISPIVKGVLP
jgi:uncharacterized protein YjbI with pentapeptide repeats